MSNAQRSWMYAAVFSTKNKVTFIATLAQNFQNKYFTETVKSVDCDGRITYWIVFKMNRH